MLSTDASFTHVYAKHVPRVQHINVLYIDEKGAAQINPHPKISLDHDVAVIDTAKYGRYREEESNKIWDEALKKENALAEGEVKTLTIMVDVDSDGTPETPIECFAVGLPDGTYVGQSIRLLININNGASINYGSPQETFGKTLSSLVFVKDISEDSLIEQSITNLTPPVVGTILRTIVWNGKTWVADT